MSMSITSFPGKECQEHAYENLIALCPNCHRRAGGGEIDRKSQRMYKANLRFAHDKFSQFEVDVLFALFEIETGGPLPWPPYVDLLLKRLFDAEYIQAEKMSISTKIGAFQTSPDKLFITDKGRDFVKSLGLHHDDGV
jgi:hypothetical protein